MGETFVVLHDYDDDSTSMFVLSMYNHISMYIAVHIF